MLVEKAVRIIELEVELFIMSFDGFSRCCCLISADKSREPCPLYETALRWSLPTAREGSVILAPVYKRKPADTI